MLNFSGHRIYTWSCRVLPCNSLTELWRAWSACLRYKTTFLLCIRIRVQIKARFFSMATALKMMVPSALDLLCAIAPPESLRRKYNCQRRISIWEAAAVHIFVSAFVDFLNQSKVDVFVAFKSNGTWSAVWFFVITRKHNCVGLQSK